MGVDGSRLRDQLVKLQAANLPPGMPRAVAIAAANPAPGLTNWLRCPRMDFRALNRGELFAIVGGILLGVSLALPWYSLGNSFAHLNSCHGPNSSCSGWDSLTVLRYFLLAGAAAPLVLAWVIIRGHALSWPRGELTAVVGVITFVLTFFVGVIDRPGSPSGQISIAYGWGIGLLGTLLLVSGAVFRSQESAPRRKPPGVL